MIVSRAVGKTERWVTANWTNSNVDISAELQKWNCSADSLQSDCGNPNVNKWRLPSRLRSTRNDAAAMVTDIGLGAPPIP